MGGWREGFTTPAESSADPRTGVLGRCRPETEPPPKRPAVLVVDPNCDWDVPGRPKRLDSGLKKDGTGGEGGPVIPKSKT